MNRQPSLAFRYPHVCPKNRVLVPLYSRKLVAQLFEFALHFREHLLRAALFLNSVCPFLEPGNKVGDRFEELLTRGIVFKVASRGIRKNGWMLNDNFAGYASMKDYSLEEWLEVTTCPNGKVEFS